MAISGRGIASCRVWLRDCVFSLVRSSSPNWNQETRAGALLIY